MHPAPFVCIFILLSCFASCMAHPINPKTVDGLIGLQPQLQPDSSSEQLNKPEPTGRSGLDSVWFLYKLSSKSQNNVIHHQGPRHAPAAAGDHGDQAKTRRQAENNAVGKSRARKEGCKVFYWKSFTAC